MLLFLGGTSHRDRGSWGSPFVSLMYGSFLVQSMMRWQRGGCVFALQSTGEEETDEGSWLMFESISTLLVGTRRTACSGKAVFCRV